MYRIDQNGFVIVIISIIGTPKSGPGSGVKGHMRRRHDTIYPAVGKVTFAVSVTTEFRPSRVLFGQNQHLRVRFEGTLNSEPGPLEGLSRDILESPH